MRGVTWALVMGLTCGVACAGDIVQNGDFSALPPGMVSAGTRLDGWTVIRGSVGVVTGEDGRKHVVCHGGGLEQRLRTTPGQEYQITAEVSGTHGSSMLVRAGTQQVEIVPTSDGESVVRTWTFVANGGSTLLDIYPSIPADINLNHIAVEPARSADEMARVQLQPIYTDMDHDIYYHRVDQWFEHTRGDFTWKADGQTLDRDALAANMGRMFPADCVVATRALSVSHVSPAIFVAQVEQSVNVNGDERKTSFEDTWAHTAQGWLLLKRAERHPGS
ncbi:MAG TPA: hypothetical protein VGO93_01535 [Candidatus Xenobia bacterium]|jgi:hypothetical protein